MTTTDHSTGAIAGPGADRAATTGWLGPAALGGAGALFVAYPALRPYSDETTLAGAEAMASTAWLVSHVMGMAAFVLLCVGLWVSARDLRARWMSGAGVAAGVGTALVLPYYGAEAFGIQVIAARALADGDASLLELAEQFRMAPVAMTMFGLGLLGLAVAGIVLAGGMWQRGGTLRLGGTLAGAALVLYLPQFFTPAAVRIGHGVVLGAGLVLLALALRPVAPGAAGRHPAA